MGNPGPLYAKALEALQQACFGHPGRDVLGMSHGPFSGVNVALGIIDYLERDNARLRAVNADMYQALRLTLNLLQERQRDDDHGMRVVISNALAKADGRDA